MQSWRRCNSMQRFVTLLTLGVGLALGITLGLGHAEDAQLELSGCMEQPQTLEGDNSCWVLTHLQKCGGSTLKHILAAHWEHEVMIYDSAHWLRGGSYSTSFGQNVTRKPEPILVAGSYTEGLRASVNDACKWFIVFRHPIPRLVSAYFYCRKSPHDTACARNVLDAETTDLLGFAKHWGNFGMRQLALSFVQSSDVVGFAASIGMLDGGRRVDSWAGWYLLKLYLDHQGSLTGGDENTVMYGMLDKVREMISHDFAVVGVLEDFETTLKLFDCVLGVPDINWGRGFHETGKHNVDNKFRSEKDIVLDEAWTNAELKSYLNLDLLMYEHALAVFNNQARLHGFK